MEKGNKTMVWLWVDFNMQKAVNKSLCELIYGSSFFYNSPKNHEPGSIDFHINLNFHWRALLENF